MSAIVVLTREAGRNEELLHALVGEARVLEIPATRTIERAPSEVASAIALACQDGAVRTVAVTSARAAAAAALALSTLPAHTAVVAIGEATADALRRVTNREPLVGTGGAELLAELIEEGPVLVLGAREMRPELFEALARRDLETRHVAVYETRSLHFDEAQSSALRHADAIVVHAPSAWHALSAHVATTTTIVAVGETTAGEVRATHHNVVVAREFDLVGAVRVALAARPGTHS